MSERTLCLSNAKTLYVHVYIHRQKGFFVTFTNSFVHDVHFEMLSMNLDQSELRSQVHCNIPCTLHVCTVMYNVCTLCVIA